MKEYKTYLFDIDGTLLDTMELIYRCFDRTCRTYASLELSREHVWSYVGVPLATQMEIFLGPLGEKLDEVLAFHMDYQASIYQDYLKVYPGVEEVLSRLHQDGKTLGIVTSRTSPSLLRYLDHFDLKKYFSVIATPECTDKHKPSPEPVLWALDQSKSSPENTLFLGDASVDINSGHAAAVNTAFAKWGPNRLEDLPIAPDFALDSIYDLLKKD